MNPVDVSLVYLCKKIFINGYCWKPFSPYFIMWICIEIGYYLKQCPFVLNLDIPLFSRFSLSFIVGGNLFLCIVFKVLKGVRIAQLTA